MLLRNERRKVQIYFRTNETLIFLQSVFSLFRFTGPNVFVGIPYQRILQSCPIPNATINAQAIRRSSVAVTSPLTFLKLALNVCLN